MNEKMTTPT